MPKLDTDLWRWYHNVSECHYHIQITIKYRRAVLMHSAVEPPLEGVSDFPPRFRWHVGDELQPLPPGRVLESSPAGVERHASIRQSLGRPVLQVPQERAGQLGHRDSQLVRSTGVRTELDQTAA